MPQPSRFFFRLVRAELVDWIGLCVYLFCLYLFIDLADLAVALALALALGSGFCSGSGSGFWVLFWLCFCSVLF